MEVRSKGRDRTSRVLMLSWSKEQYAKLEPFFENNVFLPLHAIVASSEKGRSKCRDACRKTMTAMTLGSMVSIRRWELVREPVCEP